MNAPHAADKLALLKSVEIKKLKQTLAMLKLRRNTIKTVGSEFSVIFPYWKRKIINCYNQNRQWMTIFDQLTTRISGRIMHTRSKMNMLSINHATQWTALPSPIVLIVSLSLRSFSYTIDLTIIAQLKTNAKFMNRVKLGARENRKVSNIIQGPTLNVK